jgi:hypothetical protein
MPAAGSLVAGFDSRPAGKAPRAQKGLGAKEGRMKTVYMRSPKNGVAFCIIYWKGPGYYAGFGIGDTLEVSPVEGIEEACSLCSAYMRRAEKLCAVNFGRVANLRDLLFWLREQGYEVEGWT